MYVYAELHIKTQLLLQQVVHKKARIVLSVPDMQMTE